MKKGISLITLVITIIVIIILAGAVILSLANNNPIDSANEAVFKQNASGYKSELDLWKTSEYLRKQGSFNPNVVNATKDSGSYEGKKLYDIIPSMKAADLDKFEIRNGELVIKDTASEKEKEWFNGITVTPTPEPEYIRSNDPIEEGETGTALTINSTIDGEEPAYNNPIIPAGFIPVNTADANWGAVDYNDGLVIEDPDKNQYVWVPVNLISNFKKVNWSGSDTSMYTDDFTTEEGNEIEASVLKYGGFYIARYEASKGAGDVAESKRGKAAWTGINYNDAKSKSLSLATTKGYTSVKSTLITGKIWDTVLTWIQTAGKNVTDSTAWGNHTMSVSPADVLGYGSVQVTGYSENWKAKNLYDIAGNVSELSQEYYLQNSTHPYARGGWASDEDDMGGHVPASDRGPIENTYTDSSTGFRVAIYVK